MPGQAVPMNNDWKTIDYWIQTIMTEGTDRLNDWESNFISDIQDRVCARNYLTPNQESKLEQIYEKITK